ncbi:tRNA pseudouridine synthase B [Crinalium epipsammum PCC 9333]|uniref:tRNA pseudouridine synthase B n=1 Tax=Crinalium epipsammum PCC 9333 TaxID=1173022 RepID=K9W254_9CYAN|nr:tRNA pseudouridine(55) synthase TruB [Crinalium epipsammum]AFZ14296.1 tRNA pseudouridine synthase B [Crinalium epipsammum PCC 9333]
MQGFLNLNKPAGFTSHDCVARVRKLLRLKRVGHGGTLDPAVTGVLPIALGKATRLLQYLRQDKAYQGTIKLGVTTTTDDLAGEIISQQPVNDLSLEAVTAALQQFEGTIQQIPPNYSAIQVQGKRLYDLARAGEKIDVPARTVEVYQIDVLDWRGGEFPEIDVAIACGSGTYIRAIARDLGIALNTGGVLASLIRTASCGFNLADSITFEELEEQIQRGTFQPIPPPIALTHLISVNLSATDAKRWCQGQKILNPQFSILDITESEEQEPSDRISIQAAKSTNFLRVYDENQQFLGIANLTDSDQGKVLTPQMVFEAL